ncbi:MAG: DUF2634 domain-containing protein [Christensenellaceae bacterium]|nr:DUF2634 domain-containing protein [Christensenellaceae bacterium]
MDESIFPFFRTINYSKDSQKSDLPLYTDVEWDEENNCAVLDSAGEPVITTGIAALRGWIVRALRTRRYAEEMHTWQYGSELESLIGKPWQRETRLAEAKRYIAECLTQNPYITAVTVHDVSFKDTRMSISCTVSTVYDRITIEVENV